MYNYPTQIIQKANKLLAISNVRFNSDIEDKCKEYDCVIRFNKGSNPIFLSSTYDYYSGVVDVCVLSGWIKGDFGDWSGFQNKPILFSRPHRNKRHSGILKTISVRDKIYKQIATYTKNIEYIPEKIYNSFVKQFNYDHPTTGLITLFYIKEYLHKNIDTINFVFNANTNTLDNIHLQAINHTQHTHNLLEEQKIFDQLKIKNYLI